jgi:hypothetical protein
VRGSHLLSAETAHAPARRACKTAANDPAGAEVHDGLELPPGSDEEERRRSAAPLPGRSGTTWSRASCDVIPASTDRRSAGKQQSAIAAPLRPEEQRAERPRALAQTQGEQVCSPGIGALQGRRRRARDVRAGSKVRLAAMITTSRRERRDAAGPRLHPRGSSAMGPSTASGARSSAQTQAGGRLRQVTCTRALGQHPCELVAGRDV